VNIDEPGNRPKHARPVWRLESALCDGSTEAVRRHDTFKGCRFRLELTKAFGWETEDLCQPNDPMEMMRLLV